MHKTKNTWRIDGDTLVLLNRKDGVEIYCPAALAPYVLQHTWHIVYYPNGNTLRVQTTIRVFDNGCVERETLALHTLILDNTPEEVRRPGQTVIDHEDGNPVNNLLDNIRYATRLVNQQNMRDVQRMPMRGVSYDKRYRWRSWYAKIAVDGKQVGGEHFYTAREAEEHYLKLKRQYHTETPEVWYEQYAACQASGYWDAPAPTNSSAPAPATLFESMESR